MMISSTQLREMSVEERIRLLDAVWDSFGDVPLDLTVPESHKRELDARLADESANPSAGEPWEIVKQRLMSEP